MQPAGDPYRVLGVRRDATPGELKSAHRRLAKAHHPDAGGDPTRFLAIQAAYQVLADPVQRSRWDATHSPGPVSAHDPWTPRPHHDRAARQPGAGRERGPARPGRGATPEARRAAAADPSSGAGPDAGPGRDPASATWTWTASGVPWWEEGARRGGGGYAGPPADGPGTGGRGPAEPAAGENGKGHRRGRAARPADGQQSTAHGERPRTAPRDQTGAVPGGPPEDAGRHRAASPGGPTMDVYVRSSGAAWSAASRAYFRKVAAEVPHGARLGHSSRTGRVGWEPSPEEIAQAAAGGPPSDDRPAAGPRADAARGPLGVAVRRLVGQAARAIRR